VRFEAVGPAVGVVQVRVPLASPSQVQPSRVLAMLPIRDRQAMSVAAVRPPWPGWSASKALTWAPPPRRGGPVGAGEPDVHVAGLGGGAQLGWLDVDLVLDVEQVAGDRGVDEALPAGVLGEQPGDVGRDRPVAGQLGRVVAEVQQGGAVST
jgi:hypothetical protein